MSTRASATLSELFGVEGKAVLVTGGSRGIGRAIASGFVRAGARVYICARDLEQCQASAEELSSYGECIPVRADLGTTHGCLELARHLAERESKLHVLVNNAGSTWHEQLATYPEAQWDSVMNVNLKSPFFLTQALLPLLTAAATREDPARVINVGSIRGYLVPQRPSFAYTASKGAIHQLTRHLAAELASAGITVNVLAPGLFEKRMSQTTDTKIRTQIPLGRKAAADDLAGAAIFLASRAGSYVTGTVIPVEGGVGVVPN
ncbi:SDR family NAD(P)-dependent oxidoreductase [Geodermatophilus sp. CPCC 205506]|uniref:SDR family NAD(P)-dependent oxidoreductase n=1 Tax=Geodermatophilus sp. CPCC 205506 TaxID=2936596 RepID=UPI003EEEE8FF